MSTKIEIHWLPYRHQSFYSRLTTDEVVQALAERVVRRRFLRWGWGDRGRFEGEVSSQGFNISRVPTYRGWYPMGIGVFKPRETGTRIDVEMKTPWLPIVGLVLLLVPLVALAVSTIESGEFFAFTLHGGCFVLLVGGGFAVFIWLIMMLFFDYEVNKARQFLEDVFKAPNTPTAS